MGSPTDLPALHPNDRFHSGDVRAIFLLLLDGFVTPDTVLRVHQRVSFGLEIQPKGDHFPVGIA
jgi:hypothetical protein